MKIKIKTIDEWARKETIRLSDELNLSREQVGLAPILYRALLTAFSQGMTYAENVVKGGK